MSGNYSGDINYISNELKDIFAETIVIVESFKFWKYLHISEYRVSELKIELNLQIKLMNIVITINYNV